MHPFLYIACMFHLFKVFPRLALVNGLISCCSISFTVSFVLFVFLHLAAYCWSVAECSVQTITVTCSVCSCSFFESHH